LKFKLTKAKKPASRLYSHKVHFDILGSVIQISGASTALIYPVHDHVHQQFTVTTVIVEHAATKYNEETGSR
jgi:hypothetical protein